MAKDFIDFSNVKRLEVRSDSWDKVVMRLDKHKRRTISFKILSGISMAASFVLVCLSVVLSSVSTSNSTTEFLAISAIVGEEQTVWYNSLGNSSETFEVLAKSPVLSYLNKPVEEK